MYIDEYQPIRTKEKLIAGCRMQNAVYVPTPSEPVNAKKSG
jgi:hypothetical protein